MGEWGSAKKFCGKICGVGEEPRLQYMQYM